MHENFYLGFLKDELSISKTIEDLVQINMYLLTLEEWPDFQK